MACGQPRVKDKRDRDKRKKKLSTWRGGGRKFWSRKIAPEYLRKRPCDMSVQYEMSMSV